MRKKSARRASKGGRTKDIRRNFSTATMCRARRSLPTCLNLSRSRKIPLATSARYSKPENIWSEYLALFLVQRLRGIQKATCGSNRSKSCEESSTMGLLRFPFASPRRSCGADDGRALSSRASRTAGAVEGENGTAVDRLSQSAGGLRHSVGI